MDDVVFAITLCTVVLIMTLLWWWDRSRKNSSEDDQHDYPLGNAILTSVSNMLSGDWIDLCLEMGLDMVEIDRIRLNEDKYGTKMMAFKALTTWRSREGLEANKEKLMEHLRNIGRKDIIHKISTMSPRTKEVKSQHESLPLFAVLPGEPSTLTLTEFQELLRHHYNMIQIIGLPWLENVHLTMEDHFIQLEMIYDDKVATTRRKDKFELQELFHSLNADLTDSLKKFPSRILVEGHPGYGKTTLASKICYDYSREKMYLKPFDIVLFSSLRTFDGNLEKMLFAASGVREAQHDAFFHIIQDKSNRILLILDGFDELANQHAKYILSLITGKQMAHVTLLVTSRPGKFTSNEDVKSILGLNLYQEVGLNIKGLWDKKAKIIGISAERQSEFIEKHLSNFPSHTKEYVKIKINQMKKDKILRGNFLQCPLFILMVILLLTENETTTQNLKTTTALYKGVMNFVIRRHLTKTDDPSASKADLFSFDIKQRPFYVDLMSQLGEFSLFAVSKDSLSFSKEDVLGSPLTRNKRILDLGVLTKTVKITGILEEEFYEPVHKSLLEFLAAYYLWIQFRMGPYDEWKKNVCKIRPSFASADSSLVFLFFTGLMGDEAGSIFNSLTPYVSEYNSNFASLISSLTETNMTDKLLSSLLPFLPPRWRIYWNESDILYSYLPPKLMQKGIKRRIFKEIVWDLDFPVCSHCDIEVDILKIVIYDDMSPLSENQTKKIKCKSLVCQFYGTESAGNKWNDLLSYFSFLQFHCISFYFSNSDTTSLFLPFICQALTNGELKDVEMQYIFCYFSEGMSNVLDMLIDLIRTDRFAALYLQLDFNPSREQLDVLFSSISKSSRLTTFLLYCNQASKGLVVDLGQLCNGGQKAYKRLQISNATAECKQKMQNPNLKIKYLNLAYVNVSLITHLLNLFQVELFQCNLFFPWHLLDESLTELAIEITYAFKGNEMFSPISKFHSLKRLCFTMTSFEYHFTSIDNSFWQFIEYLPLLKGIEIHEIEYNISLATDLVESIVKYLDKRSSLHERRTSSSVANLGNEFNRLHYLCLQSQINPDINDPSPSDSSKMQEIISLLLQLKTILSKKELIRVDVIFYAQSFIRYMSKFKPIGFSSFVEVFSPEEGFDVQHDLTGMREDDPVERKLWRETFSTSIHRFSVRLTKNKP